MNCLAVVTGFILLSSLPFALAQSTEVSTWKVYCNARFAYCLQYPRTLIAQGEADNGDGQVFRSRDGRVELRAYGSLNALEQTPVQYLKAASQGKRIKYTLEKPGFFVLSGLEGKNIVYQKTIYQRSQGKYVSLILSYPQSLRSSWDKAVGRLSKSLVLKP